MKRILKNNVLFLFTSIFCSGMQNIVTQIFYDQYYNADKSTLMPLTLFLGAVATLAGIMYSAKHRDVYIGKLYMYACTVLVSFSILFCTSSCIMYITAYMTACYSINYLYNIFDNYLGYSVEEEKQNVHVKVLLVYQMMGYIIAPLFFSRFVSNKVLCVLLIAALGSITYIMIINDYRKRRKLNNKDDTVEKLQVKNISQENKFFIIYCGGVFTSVYMLISSLPYLFKDYLQVDNYAIKSSVFLASLVLVSGITIVMPSKRNNSSNNSFNIKKLICAPVCILIALAAVLIIKSTSFIILGVIAVLCGYGYGGFLSESKSYANLSNKDENMISLYNKTMTISTLTAYALSTVIGFMDRRIGCDVTLMKCILIEVLMTGAVMILAYNKNKEKSNENISS